MLRDPELIKQITIKDFDHFTDHRIFTEEANKSGLWSQNVFSLKGAICNDTKTQKKLKAFNSR